MWQSRCSCNHCMVSLLCVSYRRCVWICLCASVCTRYACVQDVQYNASRVSSSCLCANSRGVCVWLVHSRQSNHNIVASNSTIKHTSWETCIVGPHTRLTKHTAVAKALARHIIETPIACSPFSTCDAHGISSQPHLLKEPCTWYHIIRNGNFADRVAVRIPIMPR